jgi:RecA/RadA recombinase
MSKVDISAVLSDVSKLYSKDKKIQRIICSGGAIKTEYRPEDCACAPEGHLLTELIGLPGIPYNKIVQVAGPPDSGKSTAAMKLMVKAQQDGVVLIVWDAEEKFDAHRFKQVGGDPEQVILVRTNEIRYGGELVRKFIHAVKKQSPEAKMLLVWDSVGGSQSRAHAEFELDSDKSAQPGQDAKENAMIMKAIVALINTYPDSIAVYLANQVYAKIGFMQKGDAASGGKKIEFHSSVIIFLKRIKTLVKQQKGVRVKEGIITRATVSKNHLSQGALSVHQKDFKITATGMVPVDGMEESEDDDE